MIKKPLSDKFIEDNLLESEYHGINNPGTITESDAKKLSMISYSEGRIEVFKGLINNYNESKIKPFSPVFKLAVDRIIEGMEKELKDYIS